MLAAYRPAHSPSSIAVSQLKNTGSFRLLNHKNGVADSILMYDKWNERIIEHNAFYGNDFDLYWAAFYPICDVKIFRDPAYATFTAAKRTLTDKPVPPLHLTQQTLSVFTGHTTRQVLINQVNRLFVQNQLQKATRLIDFLKKEYHLTKN